MRACVCRLASRLLRCDLLAEYHKSDERKECRLRTFRYFSTLFSFVFFFFLLLSVLTCKCFMITIVVVNFTSIIVVFSSDCSVCINNDD